MLSKKRKSLCSCANAKEAPPRKQSGEKVSKTFDQPDWVDVLAATDKGSRFEQAEKLLALDEEDMTFSKHYFIGAFAIQSGNSNI